MRRFLLVHGMKRSGNHAVIQWMLAQEHFLFCNNILPVAPILHGRKAVPAPRDFTAWLREVPGSAEADTPVCASLEDHPPALQFFQALPPATPQVLIIRDPANLFASRIRKASAAAHPAYPRGPGPLLTRVIEGWKAHAREYLGLTSFLRNKVGIFFNAWFSNPGYRRQLSERLGLVFSDAGFRQVSAEGGGSSFDHTAFDGDNQRMNVLARRSQLDQEEARFLAEILADEELRELGRRVERHPLG